MNAMPQDLHFDNLLPRWIIVSWLNPKVTKATEPKVARSGEFHTGVRCYLLLSDLPTCRNAVFTSRGRSNRLTGHLNQHAPFTLRHRAIEISYRYRLLVSIRLSRDDMLIPKFIVAICETLFHPP